MSVSYEFRVVMFDTSSALKRCSVRLFVRGLMSYLRYLCFFAYGGVKVVLCFCFVCLRLVYTYCVVFLFCFSLSCVPYVTSFSRLCCVFVLFVFVLCTLCCQFL